MINANGYTFSDGKKMTNSRKFACIESENRGIIFSRGNEMARTIKTIRTSFPLELKAVSDIHSTSEFHGILDTFGRGMILENGIALVMASGSHASMGNGVRFYFGKRNDTVYIVSKNSIDENAIKKALPMILSVVFNKFGLSCNGRLEFVK
jgi:hypothetical protein